MTDIENRITGFLRDEADHAALPTEMYQRVLRRARIRRLVTATVASVAMIAIVVAGVVTTGALRSTTTIAPAGPDDPLVPPASLRDQVPDEHRRWIEQGLVLLYRDGGVHHLFFEGVVPLHCPRGASERDPELCISTAVHLVWDRATPDVSGETLDHDLVLPELPEGAEVLWQGVPEEGSIGIRSPGACDRLERFESYECKDGVPVYVLENGRRRDTGDSPTKDCPLLKRPGRHARRRATAAAQRWTRTHEWNHSGGTGFQIEVQPSATAGFVNGDTSETPQGGCFARDIPNREQTWRRSWVATIRWRYPEGSEAANSASLASSIIFLGRTVEGWKVYYQFH